MNFFFITATKNYSKPPRKSISMLTVKSKFSVLQHYCIPIPYPVELLFGHHIFLVALQKIVYFNFSYRGSKEKFRQKFSFMTSNKKIFLPLPPNNIVLPPILILLNYLVEVSEMFKK